MLGDANKSITMNANSWTNVHAKNVTAYIKSKTLAEKSAWDFINAQTSNNKLELVVVNPGPIYGPTLTGNLNGESMDSIKKLITGKLPMLPNAVSVMSDVRDIATIQVLALENSQAVGKRFIVTTKQSYSIKQLAEVLKSNGYNKVSTRVAPDFLLKFMANFLAEVKGALPFIGNNYQADISNTVQVFNWKPIPFEKTIIDAAKSIQLQ
jgi:dihydroflavonol-4-reductase